ncbi:hypothetical protein COY95_04950 [Candidatus Woesearchaeota archaeon CG_4_10_14_0_8_um_filter_47_5]|nr:MAG: hypothetical protein COY95_04950 [Candidatus Woesearchaeota archaeon CG_4_10_14_0_8_um_filter_47_5]
MIAVIGAGPAGCHYASLLDEDVTLVEEHSQVGKPVSCTGILTSAVTPLLPIPKELIVTTIRTQRIIAPDSTSLDIDLRHPDIVIDRAAFDCHLAQKAVDNGAELLTGHRFLGYRKKIDARKGETYTIKITKGTLAASMLVGADGPRSAVAQEAGIYGRRTFLTGLQARVRYHGEPGVSEVRLGAGEFSWIVPEDEHIARVGIIGTGTQGNTATCSGTNLYAQYKKLIGSAKILEHQSGIVPLYNPHQKLQQGNVFLIGDAATQVKATTYGGIIYGLQAAQLLAKSPHTYPTAFARSCGRDLWLSLEIRKALNAMNTNQCNELISIFSSNSTKKIIEEHDRDYPSRFTMQLLAQEPRFWKLGLDVLSRRISSLFSH